MNDFIVSIVVPCYNEADNISPLIARIQNALQAFRYELILVNDGSKDGTQQAIELAQLQNRNIKYISFSRNFGHQAALKAGIDHARGDCIATMDADLQHPPETLPEMIDLWHKGFQVVTTFRKASTQSKFKNITSKWYYKILSSISDYKIKTNAPDFRVFDRKIADIIRQMPERELYFQGIFHWVGYRQVAIAYPEGKRDYGSTKYTFKELLNLASNGITSSSIKPLRFALSIGVFFALLAFIYGLYAIVMVFLGLTVRGWASIVASIVFLSGIQLIVLGVMGEYLGKLYMENKHRPGYLIAKTNINSPEFNAESNKGQAGLTTEATQPLKRFNI